jgi:hypothetical protein
MVMMLKGGRDKAGYGVSPAAGRSEVLGSEIHDNGS